MSSVGQVIGGAIGFFLGGPLGAQIGMMVGGVIDPPKGPTIHGPRLSDLSVQTSTTNAPIPRLYGTMATHGNVFWLEKDRIRERTKKKKTGGKGGGGQKVKTYTYFATFAVGLCKGPIAGVRRVWVGSKLIYDASTNNPEALEASVQAAAGFKVYYGTDTQEPDPRMQADKGVANTPAYRGLAYLVFYDYPLKDHGNSLMGAQVKVEVVASGNTLATPVMHLGDFSPYQTILGGWQVNSMAYGNGVWMAVGSGGRQSHSTDNGVTWSAYQTIFSGNTINSVAYGDGVWVAGGAGGVSRSTDNGVTWSATVAILGGMAGVNTVAYDNGVWIAAGGGTRVSRSTDNGVTWSAYQVIGNTGDTINSVAYGDGVWIAVTNVYGRISRSTDNGVTWGAYQTVSGSSNFRSVAYGNGVWIAVGDSGQFSRSTDNGVSWSAAQATTGLGGGSLYSVAYRAGLWLVGGGTGRVSYSTDNGVTWSASQMVLGTSLVRSVFYGNGLWGAGGADGRITYAVWKLSLDPEAARSAPLSSIVQKEALLSKLVTVPDLDVSELYDGVRGYRVSQVGAIRGGLEPLQAAWPFDVVQAGYKIKFLRRPKSSIVTIDSDKLMPETELQIDMEMDSQLPREVDIKYMELNREYDMSQQIAKRENTDAVNRHDIELAIVLTAEEALQKAEVLLYLWWLERYDVVFSLPPQYRGLEVSDVVTITGKWGVYELRLIEVTYTPDGRLDCKAKYNSAAVYASTAVADTGVVPGQTLGLSGPSVYKLLDIPLLTDELDTPGLLAAMCGYTATWPGGLIVRSTDGGQTWDDLEGFTDPVSMGTARTSIGAGVTNLIDATNNFLVDMIAGELESVTKLQMLNGANHFAYGAHGRWEIIAARDCVLQGDGSYLLHNLLRGRFGTEHNMTNHAAGDTLVLLTDPDLSFIVMNSNQIGQAKLYRGVTADQDIDTDTNLEFTYHGVNLKPLSPVYLNGHRHPTTRDWTLTWVRRGRISPEWRDLVDVPVGEATQAYEIEIWNSAYTTLYRTLTSATQTVDYTSAQQVTDFGNNQDTLYIRVFQMSAIIGRGYPLQASITRS